MKLDPWKFTCYFCGYARDFWLIFLGIVVGNIVLASSLLYCESRAEAVALVDPPPLSGAATIVPQSEGRDRPPSPSRPIAPSNSRDANLYRQLHEIRQELLQIASGLSDSNREVSTQLDSQANRLKALDDRLRSVTSYWRRLDESRGMNFGNSLYYTTIAMLGVGDFGARSVGGKLVIVIAGVWGVIAFSLVTALLLFTVNRQYRELLEATARGRKE